MFIEALFAIIKTWKQLKCLLTDEWTKMWCIYTIEHYSVIKKEWNNAICSNKDATRDYHTKSTRRERQTPCDIPYMCTIKYGKKEPIYKSDLETKRPGL